jgi:hypothetical protein
MLVIHGVIHVSKWYRGTFTTVESQLPGLFTLRKSTKLFSKKYSFQFTTYTWESRLPWVFIIAELRFHVVKSTTLGFVLDTRDGFYKFLKACFTLDRDNHAQTGLWTTLCYYIICDSCLQKFPILQNSNKPSQLWIYSTKKPITNTWNVQLHCSRKRTRWGRKWRAGGGWREAAIGRSPWRHPPGWRWTPIWHRRPGSPHDPRVSTCSTLEDSS